MLIRVDGVRESLQADIQIVRDRVEQSFESANSIIHLSGMSFPVVFHSLWILVYYSQCQNLNQVWKLSLLGLQLAWMSLLRMLYWHQLCQFTKCQCHLYVSLMFGESTRWDLVKIQELKMWTEIIQMLEEGLLLSASFTPIDFCTTHKSKLCQEKYLSLKLLQQIILEKRFAAKNCIAFRYLWIKHLKYYLLKWFFQVLPEIPLTKYWQCFSRITVTTSHHTKEINAWSWFQTLLILLAQWGEKEIATVP